jgi:hypothetical protein
VKGTWQTDDQGVSAKAALAALVILIAVGAGAAARKAVERDIVMLVIAVVCVVIAVPAAAAVFVVVQYRRGRDADEAALAERSTALRESVRPQVTAAGPREVHYHQHLHLGPGTDPAADHRAPVEGTVVRRNTADVQE